jgi:hypothetical protein
MVNDGNIFNDATLASATRRLASELLEETAFASVSPEKQRINANIEFTLFGIYDRGLTRIRPKF